MYLACGGDVGKMEAVETIVKKKMKTISEQEGWFTRDDLMVHLHHKAEKVRLGTSREIYQV